MKVGECALEKTPTPVIVIKCLLLLGRMSPVLSRPCAAIQLLRAVQCSLPQWNFADHHHPLLPTLSMGVEFNSIQHPSIQFATPFNSPLEGGIVEGVHCPALCESVHTFWAPSGYICNIENYAGLSCLLALLLLFVWTNFPTHLTCARPNTLLMLMTDGPKDDDDDCRMDDGPRLLFESVRNNLIFCGHLGKLCIIMDLMMMSETDERT